jgi:hypothetical protein
MKVKLLREARVSLPAGTEVKVEEREAERLLAFGLAVKAEERKKATRKKV